VVECNLAKVEVASSNLVSRSIPVLPGKILARTGKPPFSELLRQNTSWKLQKEKTAWGTG
jgi:hypothetical protein